LASTRVSATPIIGSHRGIGALLGRRCGADKIARNAWLGRGVTVLPGVTIGAGAVVGANAW